MERGDDVGRPIYKMSMEEVRWGGDFPGIEASIPMIQSKIPLFRAKSVHPSVNLPSPSSSVQ
jgi:hypothetical protein